MKLPTVLTLVVALLTAQAAVPQDTSKAPPKLTPAQQAEMDAYMKAGTPGDAHKRLAATAGKYSVKMKNWYEPGAPPAEESGTATRTMALDGRVLVEHFEGTMMGSPFTGHGMTGYDNVTGQYWSTWNDSMSTGLMVSTGSCDAGNACKFEGSWNDAIKKAPVKTRMTTRWSDANTEVFEMYGPDKQGREMKMMEIVYTRQ
jgi:Protein of unknown function (DUF1579).